MEPYSPLPALSEDYGWFRKTDKQFSTQNIESQYHTKIQDQSQNQSLHQSRINDSNEFNRSNPDISSTEIQRNDSKLPDSSAKSITLPSESAVQKIHPTLLHSAVKEATLAKYAGNESKTVSQSLQQHVTSNNKVRPKSFENPLIKQPEQTYQRPSIQNWKERDDITQSKNGSRTGFNNVPNEPNLKNNAFTSTHQMTQNRSYNTFSTSPRYAPLSPSVGSKYRIEPIMQIPSSPYPRVQVQVVPQQQVQAQLESTQLEQRKQNINKKASTPISFLVLLLCLILICVFTLIYMYNPLLLVKPLIHPETSNTPLSNLSLSDTIQNFSIQTFVNRLNIPFVLRIGGSSALLSILLFYELYSE